MQIYADWALQLQQALYSTRVWKPYQCAELKEGKWSQAETILSGLLILGGKWAN